MKSELFNHIFEESVTTYHKTDDIDFPNPNLYAQGKMENLLFTKNWIDTVQWHLEDIIREEGIDPAKALEVKRRIDKSNQDRTDLVEQIDDVFFEKFKGVDAEGTRLNTETPAWAIDRLSILHLKIYHMREEAERENASEAHRNKCSHKLGVLLQQKEDLSLAIDQLLSDLEAGNCQVRTYKQMKMYNDPEMNPVLRGGK